MALGLVWSSVCLCLFVSILIYDRMGGFQSKNRFPVNGRVNSFIWSFRMEHQLIQCRVDRRYYRRFARYGKSRWKSTGRERRQCGYCCQKC